MAPIYSEMKSQLQTTVDKLEQYKVINESLQAEVETSEARLVGDLRALVSVPESTPRTSN